MKTIVKLIAVVGLSLPGPCSGLATGEEGNRKLAESNYTDWPGLVDAINDESRVGQFWVNGSEWFSYSGDMEALNRVLKEFGETQVEELAVVLRPGTGKTAKVEGKAYVIDWELHITGGIARAYFEKAGVHLKHRLVPTLTINVSERIVLADLRIPERVKVLQWADLRKRTEAQTKADTEVAKREAEGEIKRLEEEAKGEGFEKRLVAIRKFVEGLRRKG